MLWMRSGGKRKRGGGVWGSRFRKEKGKNEITRRLRGAAKSVGDRED